MTNTSAFSRAKGEEGKKRKYTRKLENQPKRPLSAYNLFFRAERQRILTQCEDITINIQTTKKGKRAHRKSHGAINFSDMGKLIAAAWKALDEEVRAPFEKEAAKEMKRYQEAKEEAKQQATVPDPPRKDIKNEEGMSPSKNENMESSSKTPLQETTKMSPKGISGPQTAEAFLPPNPAHNDGPHPSSSTTSTQDYAFQCEVCFKAIFPNYDECLEHEKSCRVQRKETATIV